MAQVTPGLAWLRQGPIDRASFCVTFVRGLTQAEVLAGFGADPAAAVDRTLEQARAGEFSASDSFGPYVRVGRAGGWVFAWEEATHEGTRTEVLRNVSRRGDAVVVRHALDSFAEFAYAAGGAVVSQVVTIVPFTRTGTEPDRFLPLLRQVGLDYPGNLGEGGEGDEKPYPDLGSVLAVAEHAFGLSLTPQQVEGPWPSSRILPLLDDLPTAYWNAPGWEFHIGDPVLNLLVRHAPAQLVAGLVAGQAEALLAETNLGGSAVLADAVRAAADGHPVSVTDDSPIGVLLRELARGGYVAQMSALSGSMPASEQRAGLMRAASVRPLRVVLAEGGLPALANLLVYRRQWSPPGWREQVLYVLRGVQVPVEELRTAEQQQQQLEQTAAARWQRRPPQG